MAKSKEFNFFRIKSYTGIHAPHLTCPIWAIDEHFCQRNIELWNIAVYRLQFFSVWLCFSEQGFHALHTISLHAAFYWVSIDVGASVQFQTQIIKIILFSNYTLWYIHFIYSKNTRNKTTVPVTHNTAPRGGRQELEVRAALVPWLLLVEDEKNDLGNRSPIGPMSTGAAEVVTGR